MHLSVFVFCFSLIISSWFWIITLLRFITMLCGTENIPRNILQCFQIQFECGKYQGIFCGIMLVPHNIVMDMRNVMVVSNKDGHLFISRVKGVLAASLT